MNSTKKKKKLLFFTFSFLLNIVLFLLSFAFLGSVFATNDDYRMSLIVSGAYTGEPSSTLVFMKYPIAWILSKLYGITPAVPWYGIASILCILIPSILICYFIMLNANRTGNTKYGLTLYILFYLFIVQKHLALPQFTLTAAFMAIGWLAMLWYMPKAGKSSIYLICISLFSVISFSIRMKVFMMVFPVAMLIIAVKLINNRFSDKTYIIKYITSMILTVVLCFSVQILDNKHIDTEYKSFNTARSLVYDFGAIPAYNENKAFYDRAGIDETTFYDISARYLDLDGEITMEKMRAVADISKSHRSGLSNVLRLMQSALKAPAYFLESGVLYQTAFCTVLLVCVAFVLFRKKQYAAVTFIFCTAVGMLLEMTYLCYISRVMVRLTEVMILAISVSCILALTDTFQNTDTETIYTKSFHIYKCAAKLCIVLLAACVTVLSQNDVCDKVSGQRQINSRLEVLNTFASNDKEMFYFYDAYDFIAASSDTFAVYDDIVNTDSLGNWYINSVDYFKRNEKYGIRNSIDGLIDANKNIYYVAIGNLKNGITLTMKERYNMEPVIVRTIPYENNNIYIYTFIPCN